MTGRLALLTILSLIFISCSGDGSEDNRVCIVNDSFNVTADNIDELESEAQSNDLQLEFDQGQVAVCGTPIAVDATVANGDDELISGFLARGRSV